jgi:hypothetical protein
MPVRDTMKEQTSREDIFPRKIVAAVKKRLWNASVSGQGYVVQSLYSRTQNEGRTRPEDSYDQRG